MNELKDCPFCGNPAAEVVVNGGRLSVECTSWRCAGNNATASMEQWNAERPYERELAFARSENARLSQREAELFNALYALYEAVPDNEGGALGEACARARLALAGREEKP